MVLKTYPVAGSGSAGWYYCAWCGWESEADQYARTTASGVRAAD